MEISSQKKNFGSCKNKNFYLFFIFYFFYFYIFIFLFFYFHLFLRNKFKKIWNETYSLELFNVNHKTVIPVRVMDHDAVGKHDPIGIVGKKKIFI
jgi:glycopeptide antibiotics resistance protein